MNGTRIALVGLVAACALAAWPKREVVIDRHEGVDIALENRNGERRRLDAVEPGHDRAMSGASLLRPGIQELIQDAMRGRFAVVLAEAMDRLSRDQEDIAGFFKRMAFAGVRIVTFPRVT